MKKNEELNVEIGKLFKVKCINPTYRSIIIVIIILTLLLIIL
jgi:hypothetical protein